MNTHTIAQDVHCIKLDINTSDLFEGIWPIPGGVSLNSYIVKGEKIALIDLFRDWNGSVSEAEAALKSLNLDFSSIDYLVLNHLEPDHTGWLREFRQKNPGAQIIATQKGMDMVKSFYALETGLRVVKDGEVLDLGNGKKLTFYEVPNVHWPDTMVSYESGTGTLFSCDAFGSYGSLGDRVFDDDYNDKEHAIYEEECLRYYSNIISSFSTFVDKAIKKLAALDIKTVAPSHGIIWRKEPHKIIERYQKYASWSGGKAEKEIAIIWSSMYGNTKAGLDAVIRGIEKEGIPYKLHRVPNEDVSYVLATAYRSTGLVIAMPTYEYACFPPMYYVLDIFRRKHIFGKKALRIGSWGWVGGAKKEYDACLPNLKWESLDSVEWTGFPTEAEFALLEERGRELALSVKNS